MTSSPPITAAICTRNRGDAVLLAARSVLANRHPNFKLIIIDQSTNSDSRLALEAIFGDPRVRYFASKEVGVSKARNMALRECQTDVLVYTDDDCEVADDWLEAMQGLFAEFPRIAMAFCSVLPGPLDASLGFIPAYECRGTRLVRDFFEKCTARGMGAGMAVKRDVLLDELGGFDEMLGPGAPFSSCEEGDAAVRALLAGYQLCETDRTHVVHHGFRTWAEGRQLSQRDFSGIGAAYAKPLRAGRWEFAPVPVYELLTKAIWPPLSDLLRLRRPSGLMRTFHFLRGAVRGFRAPLNREKLLFSGKATSTGSD